MPFYTLLWHIRCQSDFDELVSLVSRPVYRGSCRMEETKVPFHPVKSGFGRMGSVLMSFHPGKSRFGRRKTHLNEFRPPKGGFGRTKRLIAEVQSQASRPIELGAAIEL